MDVLTNLLNKYGFQRLHSKLSKPIIIHCVPGAGKSSLIRELLATDDRFIAYTGGIADEPNLCGRWIKKWEGTAPLDRLVLIDEYTLLQELPDCFAAFGDPFQTNTNLVHPASFICKHSKRFGIATAALLRDLGFDITAEGDDVVQISNIYEAEPRGVVVYFEEEVGCPLRSHCVEALHVSDIQGKTFEEVTFVTGECGPITSRVQSFQCLTRHRTFLHILCPNGTYTSA
ncbi:25K [Carlavirus latensaconiti]|uniref:25K n=1 Tax=Carlavirus latensaconiti TaxID=101764 RepID=Q91UJ2_9VIRU|nr:25K protein [Aconitum latent virus]BAB56115.1 25K [Aconitum latent virus]